MSRITRYLLREFLGPLLACLVVFNLLYMIFDMFGNVSRFFDGRLPFALVLRYYAGMVSTFCPWFAPASLMLATLYTMWQLSRNSEITAMRASGIGFHRLARPFIGVAFVLSGLIVLNSEFIASDANAWSSHLRSKSFRAAEAHGDLRDNHQFLNARERRLWTFRSIDLESADSASAVRAPLTVKQENAEGDVDTVLSADGARYIDGRWWFVRPRIAHYANGVEQHAAAAAGRDARVGLVCIPWLTESPRDILLASRDWSMLPWRDMRRLLAQQSEPRVSDRFDLLYRTASPLACVVVVLFAIPAGLATARSGILRGIFTALGAFFGFFACTQLCVFLGKRGDLPAVVAAWGPVATWLLLALRLYARII